jgi:CSLREA domain-containing protein
VVETNADNTLPDSNCTLREAITNANNNVATFADCTAGSGADTITFDASLSGQTITLTADMPRVSGNLTIDGSALASQVTLDGASLYRVLYVNAGGTLALDGLTVSHGQRTSGSGLFSESATVTVENSTFSSNIASNTGGAVQNNFGIMTVSNSTFSGNTVTNIDGGAIYNTGTLTVTNSTFSGNTVPNVDGSGGGHGGGIYNSGTLTVTNSTFSGNGAATSGGGIYSTGTLNYSNTIIANSTGGDCALNAGSIGTNTTNLVEDGSCSASLSGDPSLGALADYGGSTQTMALQSGSLAIDAGDDATCAAAPVNNLDQRGVTRPLDGNGDSSATCDVGAYEAPEPTAGTTTPTPTPTNTPLGPTLTPTPTFTSTPTPTNTPLGPTPTPTPTNTPGGVSSTGFLVPSFDEPEIVKAGDNNGYEVSPGNAYAADGLVAMDANSGTSSDTSCTSQLKDKHRFYNYNFSTPSLTAVNGIEVRLTGSAATTAGTPKICVQLSWNRGDTWTAAQSVPLTTANATYILGSPTDTWGRTWALGDLSNTNFRVRVIDVSGSTSNTFSLDSLAVNITYQP